MGIGLTPLPVCCTVNGAGKERCKLGTVVSCSNLGRFGPTVGPVWPCGGGAAHPSDVSPCRRPAQFPAAMRKIQREVAPLFERFWMVLQGSVINSGADHGHNASWSAGWRECFASELRYQIYGALLAGADGLMFFRLGILESPVNATWIAATLLPALTEVVPHLPAVRSGPAAAYVAVNTSSNVVCARLYRCPSARQGALTAVAMPPALPATDCRFLLIALRWHSSLAPPPAVALPVAYKLGPHEGLPLGTVAVRLSEAGADGARHLLQGTGIAGERQFEDALPPQGSVVVYRVV